MAEGSTYPADVRTLDGQVRESGNVVFTNSANQPASIVNPVSSGSLSSLSAWVSGTAKQNPNAYPTTVVLALTCDATNNAATVAIALSPDNSTYTTVATWSVAAALNNLGAITSVVPVLIPTSWYIKLTISAHASVATSVYY